MRTCVINMQMLQYMQFIHTKYKAFVDKNKLTKLKHLISALIFIKQLYHQGTSNIIVCGQLFNVYFHDVNVQDCHTQISMNITYQSSYSSNKYIIKLFIYLFMTLIHSNNA